jgi:hypothetical protein
MDTLTNTVILTNNTCLRHIRTINKRISVKAECQKGVVVWYGGMVLMKPIAERTKSRTGAIIKQQAKFGEGGMQITVSRFGGYAKQLATPGIHS